MTDQMVIVRRLVHFLSGYLQSDIHKLLTFDSFNRELGPCTYTYFKCNKYVYLYYHLSALFSYKTCSVTYHVKNVWICLMFCNKNNVITSSFNANFLCHGYFCGCINVCRKIKCEKNICYWCEAGDLQNFKVFVNKPKNANLNFEASIRMPSIFLHFYTLSTPFLLYQL